LSKGNIDNRIPKLNALMGDKAVDEFQSLSELHQFLPAEVGGLKMTTLFPEEKDKATRELLNQRTSLVRSVATTPQMGEIGMQYDPRTVAEYIQKLVKTWQAETPLDEVHLAFEGIDPETLEIPFGKEGQGHTAPLHLVESVLTKGPEGDPVKRGPAPRKADLYDRACDMTADELIAAGISNLSFRHCVLCTEDSEGDGVPFATLREKSAGWTAVLDRSKKPRKGNHILPTLKRASNIFRKGWRSLNVAPGVVYKRFDRTLKLSHYRLNASRGDFNREARDRGIVAQAFEHQTGEAVPFLSVSTGIQKSTLPSIALRTPYHTAFSLKEMDAMVADETFNRDGIRYFKRFLMGTDSSEWDNISVIPQTWYGFLRVMLKLFKPTQRVGVIYSDEFVIFDQETQRRLEELSPGTKSVLEVNIRAVNAKGEAFEEKRKYEAEMFEVDTESYLRRVVAQASSNDIAIGDILVSGFKHVLNTTDHGNVLVGWGQRSGNWVTYLSNSIMNLIDDKYFELVVQDPDIRKQFLDEYGYELPKQFHVIRSLVAGDDKAFVVEVDEDYAVGITEGDLPDTRHLCADLMGLVGMKVNAKKQEGSGKMGPGYAGFAQMLVYQGKVFTRIMDLFRKFFWRESDEATGIDPLTGQDFRHLIGDLGNQARIANAAGSFGRDPHPWLEGGLGVLQDLDVPRDGKQNRLLPPETSEERQILTRLYNARLARRGQIPAGALDVTGLWDTPGPLILEGRFDQNQSKLRGPWNPIVKGKPPKDARPQWRGRKSKP